MTILIKGIEVPEVCADCPFRSTPELFMLEANRYQYISRCTRAGEEIEDPWRDILWQHKHKESWCPIGDVPTPHGRLKDVDVIIKDECHSCDGSCEVIECDCLNCTKAGCDTIRALNDAPTIIEAEE